MVRDLGVGEVPLEIRSKLPRPGGGVFGRTAEGVRTGLCTSLVSVLSHLVPNMEVPG